MKVEKRLQQVFAASPEILFNNNSKFILFSDCHRGDNTWADDFAHNQNIYFHALQFYYNKNFTYIEIGDGDELWETRNFFDIREAYSNIFWLLHEFYQKNRLHMIYGNHDIVKKDKKFIAKYLYRFRDPAKHEYKPLFENITIHEGLILNHTATNKKIFLVHGHQGDFINDQIWPVGRLMVRYLWRSIQLIGIMDPTSPSRNYKKRVGIEKKISAWAEKNNQIIIAAHTHRPSFPDKGQPPYFNSGCCVHPRCITGIEIEKGALTLIKWSVTPGKSGALCVGRDVLEGPKKISDL